MNFYENDVCILYNEGPIHLSSGEFEELWSLREDEPDELKWDEYFDRDYKVYGVNFSNEDDKKADPIIPEILKPFLAYGNSIEINYYKNGKQYIGFHNDIENTLAKSCIHYFSYGSTREFTFKNKYTNDVIDLMLSNNSYLIMKENTYKYWDYSVPPMKKSKGRYINIKVRNNS